MDDRLELGGSVEHSAHDSDEGTVRGADSPEREASPVHLSGPRGSGAGVVHRGPRIFVESPPAVAHRGSFTPAQRLLLLDTWQRSGLGAAEFGAMVGVTGHTLYQWKRAFERHGPAGLSDRPRGSSPGSRLSETTRRAILLLKKTHPEWGCDRIHDTLLRCDGYAASPGAILRVLEESGYEVVEEPKRMHPQPVRTFERARPNQLWQSDLFTFTLKRENRRLYLVVFLDDHSRFVVGYGVHATASGALVREVFEAAIRNFGAPEEVLTDNGTQYHTWRGKSAFRRLCERLGVQQIVSRPRHPQTLGKTERFWGTLWQGCLQEAVLASLEDARRRIGHFIDHYNFQRTHQGIEGLVPADRFFAAAPEVKETLRSRVVANALELARHGTPRKSFYLTGRIGDAGISLHTEGSRVVLTRPDGGREEVDLEAPGRRVEPGVEAVVPEPVAVTCREIVGEMEDETEEETGEEGGSHASEPRE